MTVYLTLDALMRVATAACDGEPLVRDYGLLESALARPSTTVFGRDAYLDVFAKAGALLHSLAANHGLVDGNERLAWHATAVFLYINGQFLDAPDDDAFGLVMAVAAGELIDVATIGSRLRALSHPLG